MLAAEPARVYKARLSAVLGSTGGAVERQIMKTNWKPDSWRGKPIEQVPV